MFAPGDIFEDIAIPGGIMNKGFLEWYSEFTRASERNVAVNDPGGQLPMSFKVVSRILMAGSMPVIGYENKLEEAVDSISTTLI